MYAAGDRIGAMFNENFAGATPEWVEWDLNGVVLHRILLVGMQRLQGRAFDSNGRLYAQFSAGGRDGQTVLKVLDKRTGEWISARTNLPGQMSAFLLGADGDELVYRVNRGGNVHLLWAKPD
jgi:hypothetical protein